MRPAAAAASRGLDFVCCRVAGRAYAFESHVVRFIARIDQVVPGGKGAGRVGTLKGLEPIPVYSVAALLHPSAGSGAGAHVVVTDSDGSRIGWQVDQIVRGAHGGTVEPLPLPALAGPVARRWFSGVIEETDGEPGLVCSPAGLDPRSGASAPLPGPPVYGDGLPWTGGGRNVVAIFLSAALPQCGASCYAIPGSRVVGVVRSLAARVVPGTPPWVRALAAWRGVAVPLLDLSGGHASLPDDASGRYLFVRHGTGSDAAIVGLPIDRDVVLYEPTDADVSLPRSSDVSPGVRLFTAREQTVGLLDLDTLVAGASSQFRQTESTPQVSP